MIFHIDNGSYDDKIIVSVGGTWQSINRYYKKLHDTNEDIPMDKTDFKGVHDGMFDYDADVLWLREWKNNKYWKGILRHECHHICHFTLGVRKSMSKEPEALAYHQDYLIEKISGILNKERR